MVTNKVNNNTARNLHKMFYNNKYTTSYVREGRKQTRLSIFQYSVGHDKYPKLFTAQLCIF